MLFKKLCFVGMFFLASCGWHSVYYQKTGDAVVETAEIDILPVPNEDGRILTQKLKDLLNPQKENLEKKYVLSVVLIEALNTDQGILADNTSTRATMRMTAHFTLKEKANDKLLLDEQSFASSSYNILMLPYPTVTAEDATRKRLVDVVAEQIATRLSVYFKSKQVIQ